MNRLLFVPLIGLLLLALLMGLGGCGKTEVAVEQKTGTSKVEKQTPKIETITGTIQKVNSREISVLLPNNETITCALKPQVKVAKSESMLTINELKIGQRVSLILQDEITDFIQILPAEASESSDEHTRPPKDVKWELGK
ncbi:hypothetical protein ACFL27_18360 [candidate division CSSED10-310 bacterium]|uniref:DUF5666 domain-containing protein n=1 Tax=candidate division CSSED10-310 bacterium TaxID=2855610 RepID=A0ABV6Z147_UNCC1